MTNTDTEAVPPEELFHGQYATIHPLVETTGAITTQGRAVIANGLLMLKTAVVLNNVEKGWRPQRPDVDERRDFGGLLMLVTSELSEALEEYRNGTPTLYYGPDGKPEGMAAELADAIIRLLDVADEHQLPVVRAIFEKHAYNQSRPFRHGGKRA